REIRRKLRQVIPFRADVVVDDVENDSDAALVTCIHKLLQAARPAIGILYGKWINTVISPIARARELSKRHQLNRRDSNVGQFVEVRDDALERSFGAERSDMQFIYDVVFDRLSEPVPVGPIEIGIHNL